MGKTLYIPGWFDVLHDSHKRFISDGINRTSTHEVFIGLATDDKLSSKKWDRRPLFSYEWRLLDLNYFLKENFPNLPFYIIPADNAHSAIKNIEDSIDIFTVNPEDTKRRFPRATIISSDEIKWQHTSDIPLMLANVVSLSGCIVRKVWAVLVRNWLSVVTSANDMFQSQNCNWCGKYHAWVTWGKDCWKQIQCSHETEHAERLVLEQAQPWDDIFITHAPCLSCAREIVRKKIRRVVYFEQYTNKDGVIYLQNEWIGVRKAWFWLNDLV